MTSFYEDVTYHQFQFTLWKGVIEHELDIEEMQKAIYKDITGREVLCCLDLRAAKMRDKLARIKKESLVAPIILLRQEALHVLDIFTDLFLAK